MIQTSIKRTTGSTRILVLGFVLTALMAAGLILTAKPAHAQTTFTVTNTNNSGQGSLRQAIEDANARSGADTIKFNISGAGVKTISPATELPEITGPVVIDGYTQPGSKKNTKSTGPLDTVILVELNGINAADQADGLDIRASNVVVRGLAINLFSGEGEDGITISSGTGSRIEGNFIGTDPSGTLDRGNGDSGVDIFDGGKNIVGGATPEARNLISGANVGAAVNIDGTGGNKVQGNLIGVQKDGTSPLFNTGPGVAIRSSNNVIGGTEPGEANTIANNFRVGVGIFGDTTTGNRILGNSIFGNGGLGIDLGGDGISREQDPKDPDTGPNNLQNFPEITSAEKASDGTTIKGTLDSTPSTKKKKKTFTIQFFSNPQNEDEGKTFLGQKKVTTNRKGQASFSFETTRPLTSGEKITATATGPGGNTSEFSDARTVTLAPGLG